MFASLPSLKDFSPFFRGFLSRESSAVVPSCMKYFDVMHSQLIQDTERIFGLITEEGKLGEVFS
jgi:hypothetical protein